MAEANRIFGFDGWDRESVTSTCVWTKQTGLRFAAAYVTRVRITVQGRRGAHRPGGLRGRGIQCLISRAGP